MASLNYGLAESKAVDRSLHSVPFWGITEAGPRLPAWLDGLPPGLDTGIDLEGDLEFELLWDADD